MVKFPYPHVSLVLPTQAFALISHCTFHCRLFYARRVEYRGVFSIITSPDQYTEAKHDKVVRFNGDLRVDAITMMDFCISNVLSPTPYANEHGIDASFNFDKVIHSVPQFKKEIGLCAHLTKVFDVVLFYCGHGYENTGNWYLDDGTYETLFHLRMLWDYGLMELKIHV